MELVRLRPAFSLYFEEDGEDSGQRGAAQKLVATRNKILNIFHYMNELKVFAVCIVLMSCLSSRRNYTISDKIAVFRNDSILIFNKSRSMESHFRLVGDKQVSYGGFRWENKQDLFIGVEYILSENNGVIRGNLIKLSPKGDIVGIVYKSKNGEIPGNAYLNRNDKMLLFTVDIKGDVKEDHFEAFRRRKDIVIMDYRKMDILKVLSNVGSSLSLRIHESPWVYKKNQFIYELSTERQILSNEGALNPISPDSSGVYLYDIDLGLSKMITPGARFGICCPTSNRVAYYKDNSIKVLDLSDGNETEVFKIKSTDKLANIHWTHDGGGVYIAYYDKQMNKSIQIEKIVGVDKDKGEKDFKKINHGFSLYTWK